MIATPDFQIPAAEHFLSEPEAARFIKLSCRSLQRLRYAGGGPRYRRLGARRILYARGDLLAWADARAFVSTSDESVRAAKRRSTKRRAAT